MNGRSGTCINSPRWLGYNKHAWSLFYFSTNVYSYSDQDEYDVTRSSVISLNLFSDSGDALEVNNLEELFEIVLPTDVLRHIITLLL